MSNAIEDKTAAEDSTRPDAEGSSAETRQFVTFSVGKEMFGVPMDPVEEIIRVPETVRVPLSPVSLKGLANLRGKVLPVISLRHVFGLEEIADDDSTRALVIDNGTSLGFVVDRVSSVVSVDVSRIEEATDIRATVDTQLLSGMIKGDAGAPMIMILDFARLIEQEYSAISQAASRMAAQTIQQASRAASSAEAASDEVQLVSFEVAGQEYAFPIEQVQEIVQVPERISKVPNTSSHVIGVMTLRDRILPLVNLRELFALPTRDLDEHSRIVVVTIGEGNRRVSVGVAMDRVNEVLRISRSLVEAPPSLLSASGEAREIEALCRIDGGKRLVSIVSVEKLLHRGDLAEALVSAHEKGGEAMTGEANEQAVSKDDEEQVVVFRLDKEEYGVPIESVQEIVRVPETLTKVPKAPPFIEGVVNLRGTVLPVIDQRRRYELQAVERNDRQRIVVFVIDGMRTGFIVDSVTEVLKIPQAQIGPAPELSAHQAKLIERVANLEAQNRMILLLQVDQMLDKSEVSALTKVK